MAGLLIGPASHYASLDGTQTLTNKTLTAPTVGDMSNYTFPAGHVIKTSSIHHEDTAQIITTSASFEDSGLVVAHTTVASSTDSYLAYEAYSGMGYIGTINKRGALDVCVTDDSTTTYLDTDSICDGTYPWFCMARVGAWYVPLIFKGFCGLVTGMGMPADITSWDAGDTLYFRLFDAVDGGDFRFCHSNTGYSVTVKEIAR